MKFSKILTGIGNRISFFIGSFIARTEHPALAPLRKDNAIVITAYVRQGNVVVSYKDIVRTAHFNDNTLRVIAKAPDEKRRRPAIESFAGAVAQLLLSIKE